MVAGFLTISSLHSPTCFVCLYVMFEPIQKKCRMDKAPSMIATLGPIKCSILLSDDAPSSNPTIDDLLLVHCAKWHVTDEFLPWICSVWTALPLQDHICSLKLAQSVAEILLFDKSITMHELQPGWFLPNPISFDCSK